MKALRQNPKRQAQEAMFVARAKADPTSWRQSAKSYGVPEDVAEQLVKFHRIGG